MCKIAKGRGNEGWPNPIFLHAGREMIEFDEGF